MSENNSTNSFLNETETASFLLDAEPIVWIFISYFISFIGCVFYLILLVVFFKLRELWNGSEILLINLILLEFSLAAVQLPLQHTMTFLSVRGTSVRIRCADELLILVATIDAGNWSSLFLAAVRYLASAAPKTYQSLVDRKWNFISAVTISWIIALAINLPLYFGEGGQWTTVPPFGDCGVLQKSGLTFTFRSALGTYFPIAAAGMIYLILYLRIHVQYIGSRASIAPPSASTGSIQTVSRARHRHTVQRRLVVTRMLFASFLWNSICNVLPPIFINTFAQLFWQRTSLRLWIKTIQLCGYAFSPLIFLVLNTDYKKRAKRILKNGFGNERKGQRKIGLSLVQFN